MEGGKGRAELVRVLAEIYPDDESVRRLLEFSGIPRSLVRFGSRPVDTWFSAVSEADHRRKRADLLKVVLLERPEDDAIHLALRDALDAEDVLDPVSPSEPILVRDLEKIMGGQSTLLPISFLETGLQRSRSIGRITSAQGMGTGFLIADDLVVTNHHVIGSYEEAEQATIQFNYQEGADGIMLQPEIYRLNPDDCFVTTKADDLTIIGVSRAPGAKWGYVEVLDHDARSTRRVNIVQHPGGGPKQIALYHNIVSHVDDSRIQYYTDTLPGSSGSPLFDDSWRLVGVHHSGGNLYSHSERAWVYRNEGIVVGRLIQLLSQVARSG